MAAKKIAVVIGSLRKDSLNRKFAHEVIALAPPSLAFEIVEIGELALYNQDLEENGATAPQAWTHFRQRIKDVDGVLFFTPEYNRSVPSPLKNAIDVGSRPYGSSVWSGKPAAIISMSPGATGGSAPTTICASRWCSSTCRCCSSRKPISAAPPTCSDRTAS
jgi:chromate reductase